MTIMIALKMGMGLFAMLLFISLFDSFDSTILFFAIALLIGSMLIPI